jgi:hypothetical protein
MKRRIALVASIFIGLTAIAIAIFAKQFGLDQNTDWGTVRRVLLLVGIIAMAVAFSLYLRPERYLSAARSIQSFLSLNGTSALVCASCLFVIAVYLWFITVGYWTVLPGISADYDKLATSFQHGQLALLDQPDARLAQLANPYDCKIRGNIPFLWDESYYGGKYYLYFGPAPALVLLAAKTVIVQPIGDQYLVLAFLLGLFIFSSLLIVSIWRRFFSHLPAWTLAVAILAAGLTFPALWLLSRPAVYEAAIAGSQFFFIGGLYFAYRALEVHNSSHWRWLLAGIFWTLAIGSRPTVAIPVAFIVPLMFWRLHAGASQNREASSFGLKVAAVALPLIIGALSFAWYNQARFGSAWEFGMRYMLTTLDQNKFRGILFSMAYIWQNLQDYLLTPFSIIQKFPFLKPQPGQNPACLKPIISSIYHFEGGASLLYSAPYLLLAFIPGAVLCMPRLRKVLKQDIIEPDRENWLLAWVSIGLIGSAILSFSFLLLVSGSTTRYLEDVVPSLALLASIGLWQGYEFAKRRRPYRILYSLMVLGLAGFSGLAAILLAVTGPEERFRHLNHALLQHIISFFAH